MQLVQDVKLAARRLLKAPGFSLTVVSLLAFGVGATTTLFRVVDGVLLRPLPYPSQLSGGQQQLVAVARAIVADPKVILADEPTGNLHSGQAKEIMELFKKLNREGTTIVQVTHSEANAAVSDRVVKMQDGWIVRD